MKKCYAETIPASTGQNPRFPLTQSEFKNRRKRHSCRGNEAEVFFALLTRLGLKSASLRRRLQFLNSPCPFTADAAGRIAARRLWDRRQRGWWTPAGRRSWSTLTNRL